MRLINTANLSIEEFTGERIPLYAILSHTWGAEEISFQDMQSLMAVKQLKLGYSKIRHCCEIAAKDGFKYLWADTCCIDKTSSSELSEAINSMYRWYASAKVCFVYLADVASSEDPYKSDSGFRRSRWFTRGWTLQELLAPPDLLFYSSDWKEIGSKASLTDLISHITGIPDRILWTGDVKSASIAQRMSWASMRKTTRLEDTAYCLMGLFGVHMPMLYGEGNGAFIRLQEEIMKRTDDQTIFAWRIEYGSHNKVLASHPAAFKLSGSMIPTNRVISHRPLSVTSKGIHIELRV
ncbi:heterokaryon incompatibility protein-domain-containing protein, partial [Tricladium varicosporioides]